MQNNTAWQPRAKAADQAPADKQCWLHDQRVSAFPQQFARILLRRFHRVALRDESIRSQGIAATALGSRLHVKAILPQGVQTLRYLRFWRLIAELMVAGVFYVGHGLHSGGEVPSLDA